MSDRHVIDDPALAPGFTRPTVLPGWLAGARKSGPAVIIMSRLYDNNLAHSSGDSGSEG